MAGRDAFAMLMRGARQARCDSRAPEDKPRPAAARTPAPPGGSTHGTQLHLDLGQRDFSFASCPGCGMLYGKGLPSEERLHEQFHNAHLAAFRFQGWSSERVVLRDGPRSRLLLVLPTDPRAQWRKVSELCGRLERLLGVPEGHLLAERPPFKVFLWVSAEPATGAPGPGPRPGSSGGGGGGSKGGRVVGVLVAQLQERARRATLSPQPPQPLRGRLRPPHTREGAAPPPAPAKRAIAAGPAAATGTVAVAATQAPGRVRGVPAGSVPAEGRLRGCQPNLGDALAPAGCSTPAAATSSALQYGLCEPDAAELGAVARGAGEEGLGDAAGASAAPCAVESAGDSGGSGGGGAGGGEGGGGRCLPEVKRRRCSDDGGDGLVNGGAGCKTSRAEGHTTAATARSPRHHAAVVGGAPGVPQQQHADGGGREACHDGSPRPTPAPAPAPAPASTAAAALPASSARVVVGVRGLWVEPGSRRRGVARRMLDAARALMVPGLLAERQQTAFSALAAAATAGDDDGGAAFAAFASSYLGADSGSGSDRSCSGNGGGVGGSVQVLLYDN
ncbi:hypothetical protein GPECTOR_7g1262 [Gonium pectorale]|uniref:N-acetyltransferase domain-containing protein n=1 Tax=Gonium pectorale TaxID=33097 RepID=A0A150GU09_GONPE|nr:hypothetical protein GPECTOR_7g1262 [Gonium pectorale]|eukprot:KXZ53366.1 hypothetical protein GPECTOR_7g1262 [Gonium pectorale]